MITVSYKPIIHDVEIMSTEKLKKFVYIFFRIFLLPLYTEAGFLCYNERSVINKIFTRKFEAVQGTEVHGTKVPENLQIAERQECYYEI